MEAASMPAGSGEPLAGPPPVAEPDRRSGYRILSSGDLFRGLREVRIVHGEGEYRLRQTRAGKLILTK